MESRLCGYCAHYVVLDGSCGLLKARKVPDSAGCENWQPWEPDAAVWAFEFDVDDDADQE